MTLCPLCGEEYEEFVWKEPIEGESTKPEGDICESGLGWYVH